MKNFLKKMAALAHEADKLGYTEVAKHLDSALKIATTDSWYNDMMLEQDKADKANETQVPESTETQAPKRSAEYMKKLKDVENKLVYISRQFKKRNQTPPFTLPQEANVSEAAILVALKDMGVSGYKSWQELDGMLNRFIAEKLGVSNFVENTPDTRPSLDSFQPRGPILTDKITPTKLENNLMNRPTKPAIPN